MKPFSEQQFQKFSKFINSTFGINFSLGKKDMLKSKLLKIISRYGLDSYDEYYRMLQDSGDKSLLVELANEITINKTDFFREMNHFEFIFQELDIILGKNKRILENKEIRVWSAGCSTGQEPYSLAMVLKECLPRGTNIKILATDLSCRALSAAIAGEYPLSVREEIPLQYLGKYFSKSCEGYVVDDSIKCMITFREFNITSPFPFKHDFDIVFCRNVMIYFETGLQQQLIEKFYDVIMPGGLLFIGHSESIAGKKHRFQYIRPTIYMK